MNRKLFFYEKKKRSESQSNEEEKRRTGRSGQSSPFIVLHPLLIFEYSNTKQRIRKFFFFFFCNFMEMMYFTFFVFLVPIPPIFLLNFPFRIRKLSYIYISNHLLIPFYK